MTNVEIIRNKTKYGFEDLLEIMRLLRSENGCPWDKEQTHESIRSNFIEEVYEAIEGIDKNDPKILREELGDVLLQVIFHARISEEDGEFNIDDVIDDLCKKLVFRHTHVFGDIGAENTAQALSNWNEAKLKEKGQKNISDILDGISPSLPSLMRAQKISSKLKKAGIYSSFDEDIQALAKKLCSEDTTDKPKLAGQLLFEICNFCKENDIDCENELFKQCENVINLVKNSK